MSANDNLNELRENIF